MPPFTNDAVAYVFDCTKGLPSRVNLVRTTARIGGIIGQKILCDERTTRKGVADIEQI